MATRHPSGSVNVTVVDGTTFTGIYAPDGSLNVIVSTGTYLGLYHPCGAVQVTVVDGSSYVGFYAMDGSWNVVEADGANHPSGATAVFAVSGNLSNSPAAELIYTYDDTREHGFALNFMDSHFYGTTGKYGSAAIVIPSAWTLIREETRGLSLSFTDSTHFGSTSKYGSAVVKT